MSPKCPQPNKDPQSEDCLYLNVWTPINGTMSAPKEKLAVHVYIHGGNGGDYQTGPSKAESFAGCAQALDAKAVVVTFNYRLGILGFLALPGFRDPNGGETTGNWGLLDQRLVLQWVRDNIHAFGGDPGRVLLYGESAGAHSTLLHLVSPGSRGLFASAATFSGSSDVMAVDFLEDAYAKGRLVTDALGCSEKGFRARNFSNSIYCLRAVPLQDILKEQRRPRFIVENWIPTIDGVVIPDHPHILMQKGQAAHVPVMLGANAQEGFIEAVSQLGPYLKTTFGYVDEFIHRFIRCGQCFLFALSNLVPIDPSFQDRILKQYDAKKWRNSWLQSFFNALTDAGYHCPQRRAAALLAQHGLPARYFMLQYSRPDSGCATTLIVDEHTLRDWQALDYFWGGAHRGYDVPFTTLAPYQWPENTTCNPSWGGKWFEWEKQLASFLAGIVAAEAATGSPLPARSTSLQDPRFRSLNGSAWQAWSRGSHPVFYINAAAGPSVLEARDVLDAKCRLWDDVLDYNIAKHSNKTLPPEILPPGAPGCADGLTVLKSHNLLRRRHLGTPPLVWNDTLAAKALALARNYTSPPGNNCDFVQVPEAGFGQNSDSASMFNKDKLRCADSPFEWEDYRYPAPYRFTSTPFTDNEGATYHRGFTQIAWKNTTQLGCAATKGWGGGECFVVVCLYYPPGNVPGDASYLANVLPLKPSNQWRHLMEGWQVV